LAYQLRWVIYPQFPDDRDGIVQGLTHFTHFEFFYVDGHFNLQLINALVGLVALSVVFFSYTTQPAAKAFGSQE
jgi:ABC-type multidrug transport system permease subunit